MSIGCGPRRLRYREVPPDEVPEVLLPPDELLPDMPDEPLDELPMPLLELVPVLGLLVELGLLLEPEPLCWLLEPLWPLV